METVFGIITIIIIIIAIGHIISEVRSNSQVRKRTKEDIKMRSQFSGWANQMSFSCDRIYRKKYSARKALDDKSNGFEYSCAIMTLENYVGSFTISFFEIIEKYHPDWKTRINILKNDEKYIDSISRSFIAYILSIFINCEDVLLRVDFDFTKIEKLIDYYDISAEEKNDLLAEAMFAHKEHNKLMHQQKSTSMPHEKLILAILGIQKKPAKSNKDLFGLWLSAKGSLGFTDLEAFTFREMLGQLRDLSITGSFFGK